MILYADSGFPSVTIPSNPMKRPVRLLSPRLPVRAALTILLVAGTALAQTPGLEEGGRERLRQRYNPARGVNNDLGDAFKKLNSDTPEDRFEATRELARADDPKVVPYLLNAVTDSDIRVRIKAIDELGNRLATDATPLLVQQLFLSETNPVVQQRVLAALGKIADPRSTKPICQFLERDLDDTTRGTAIFALGEIGDTEAVDVLSDLTGQDDATTSRLASEALRKIKHRAPPAVDLFKEPGPPPR
jgi:HEAT repeat protein